MAVLVACHKPKKGPEPEPENSTHPVSYTNKAILIYTSQWDDSTVFYWTNWADPHHHGGVSSSTCLLAHVLAFSDYSPDKNNTYTGFPNAQTNSHTWNSTGACIHTDTLTFTWQAADTLPKQWYLCEAVRYNPCSGFNSVNPWMTGSLMLTPNDTLYHLNKTFNYTNAQ